MAENEKQDDKPETGPVEHIAVTGRPQDEPLPNTTLAERYKARQKAEKAADVESVDEPKKAPAKRTAKSK